MWHPWAALRNLPHITLHVHPLPAGLLGLVDHRSDTITLAPHQSQAQRRCTLTHELVHLERGPVPGWATAREERAVDEETARRLITDDDLVDGLLWCRDEHELADHLWVDVDTVTTRLGSLTDGESRWLNARLDDAEEHIA